ncbi:MAG: allantoinase AllB [Acidobacteriia bacterium]|nr:allantoinase AllB [Terriglobia bacterium]
MTLIRSRRVVLPNAVDPASIEIHDGRIAAIHAYEYSASTTIDAGDNFILPGLIDTHVHINEPGRTDWEGFHTATRAAAAGGYTTLVDMPLNNLPATTTVENLRLKQNAARGHAMVDYGLWGGVVHDNACDILPLASAGVLGYKCFLAHPGIDGFSVVNRAQLETAMPLIAEAGLPLLVHAELPGPIDQATAQLEAARCDWKRYATYLASRPDAAEIEAIRLMIELSRKHRCRVHIVHLSSAEALPDLQAARAEGLPVTVETCPHYLYFAAEDIADGATLLKCAPPIRSHTNRERLWQALLDGGIDLIATDHSPCPPDMKTHAQGSFLEAWGGIASLELGLSVVWTEAQQRDIAISQVVRWMSGEPARLAGLDHRKGAIRAGNDADLVVFDPDRKRQVDPMRLQHRHAITPYAGETLAGIVETTFVRGEKVFDRGVFASQPKGIQCSRA